MAKYTEEQLNTCSKEMLITLLHAGSDGTAEPELRKAGGTAVCS